MEVKVLEILLIEDNPGDIVLVQRALRSCKFANRVHVLEDGEAAMFYLRRSGEYADAVRPNLILLDLNLPKKDGRQVLEEIKKDQDLGVIPVVVLTTSARDEDILKAYGLHCNCYLLKPSNLEQFQKLIKGVEDFWFALAKLPPPVSGGRF